MGPKETLGGHFLWPGAATAQTKRREECQPNARGLSPCTQGLSRRKDSNETKPKFNQTCVDHPHVPPHLKDSNDIGRFGGGLTKFHMNTFWTIWRRKPRKPEKNIISNFSKQDATKKAYNFGR